MARSAASPRNRLAASWPTPEAQAAELAARRPAPAAIASSGSFGARWWRCLASQRLVGVLEHVIDRRDHFRIDFVAALAFDHVDQFLDHIDVRGFEHALRDRAVAGQPG